ISWVGTPPIVAGVALSSIALALALYGIHRLATLELGACGRPHAGFADPAQAARLAVMLTAFAPMAFYLSAVYSESLYLALSVGVFWSARNGRWAWVGILGALAAATRNTGVVLLLPAAGGSFFVSAGHNLMLFAFLRAAIPALLGVLRRLPIAYGAYVLAALAMPLSYPVSYQPLMSLPRFLVVLFPLSIWLGAWLTRHPRAQRPALLLSALLMMFFAAQFATWHWVA